MSTSRFWLFGCILVALSVAADPGKLTPEQQQAADKLKAKGALVMQLAANDDALVVSLNLLGKQAGDEDAALVKVLPKVVELNLASTAVTDAGLASVGATTSLQRLHLEHTAITDAGLAQLKTLADLEYLNLYDTAVTDKGLAELAGLKKLHKVFLWQTKVSDAGVNALKQADPGVVVNRGEETVALLAVKAEEARKAEEAKKAEELKKKADEAKKAEDAKKAAAAKPAVAAAAPVNTKCPVSGKPVDANFTFAYEGKTIGFCCGDCLAAFQKDPKAHIAKLVVDVKPAAAPAPAEAPAAKPAPAATPAPAPAATPAPVPPAVKPVAAAAVVKPVNSKCPVSGEAADAKFTFTYDGKVIAFCCADCLATFQKDPKAHIAKLVVDSK